MSSSRWVGTDTYSDPFHRRAPNRLDLVDEEPFSSDRRWIKTERPLKPVLIRRQRRGVPWPPPRLGYGLDVGAHDDPPESDRRTGSRVTN